MENIFLSLSPFIIIVLNIFIIIQLHKTYRLTKKWELHSLMLFSTCFILLYSWIGFFNPSRETHMLWERLIYTATFGGFARIAWCFASGVIRNKITNYGV